jgi:hypothetical protein
MLRGAGAGGDALLHNNIWRNDEQKNSTSTGKQQIELFLLMLMQDAGFISFIFSLWTQQHGGKKLDDGTI